MARVKLASKSLTSRPKVGAGVGLRIKRARLSMGLTQQALAGDRYTKAYISALENELVRPSVAALQYLAPRLGTSPSALLADSQPAWSRVEADLALAAGNYEAAADAYRDLLVAEPEDRRTRAELLAGLAEAEVRLTHGAEASAAASQAAELFEALGRPADAALANYWLSAGLYEQGNLSESVAILESLLEKVRAGLRVEPDFKLRLLMALAANASREGRHDAALSYLTEVRGLEAELDDRRRATYLSALSYSYGETGDYEAAIRTGYQALALFKANDTAASISSLENDIALAHLATGNVTKANELASSALARWERMGNDRHRAHVIDTQAQIALARNKTADALRLANEALELGKATDNAPAVSDALLTIARATAATAGTGGAAQAKAAFEQAIADARQSGKSQTLKRALTEYADFLAANGDHKAAFERSREALSATAR
jgi:transcriptional regulator with XRE-family HTH domain